MLGNLICAHASQKGITSNKHLLGPLCDDINLSVVLRQIYKLSGPSVQHQLENCSNTDFCCSINGFQYGQEDNVHWPFMRFKVSIGLSACMTVFEPQSSPSSPQGTASFGVIC